LRNYTFGRPWQLLEVAELVIRTFGNGLDALLRVAMFRGLEGRRPVSEVDLPQWIGRDLGLAEGRTPQASEDEMARLEHVNVTVADPDAAAATLCGLFDWKIRWAGTALETGRSVHVGDDSTYVALFTHGGPEAPQQESHRTRGGLNHIGVVVDDIDATEARVRAAGFVPGDHADYEPGRRFYFVEANGIEIEVVSYP
jgi:predicted enzyme related to lactoylglutathione lyase